MFTVMLRVWLTDSVRVIVMVNVRVMVRVG